MQNLPTDLLRAFAAVAERGGVTAASVALHRSQPAVSLQIKRLEESLEIRLFDRTGNRLRLTHEGEVLLEYAREILALNDRAVGCLRGPAVDGTVRVGIPNDFATTLLPAALGRFADRYPRVTLEVDCALSTTLVERVRRGEFDLAVAMSDRPPRRGVIAGTDRLVWVGALRSPAAENGPLPLVVYPEGCLYRRAATRALDRVGREWRVAMTSSSLAGLQAAAAAGLGVTVLSEMTVPAALSPARNDGWLPPLPDVSIGLYRGSRRLADAARYLHDFLAEELARAHPDTSLSD